MIFPQVVSPKVSLIEFELAFSDVKFLNITNSTTGTSPVILLYRKTYVKMIDL